MIAGAGLLLAALAHVSGCGSDDPPGGGGSGAGGSGAGGSGGGIQIDSGLIDGGCEGLACDVPKCDDGVTTSISGTAFAPNATLPLYNAIVYVPKFRDKPLDAFEPGVSCDRCGTLDNLVRATLSDAQGKFELKNIPAGKDIPLVVQIGKWRRKVVLPEVTACQDNPVTDPEQTRLPRNQAEGDLPQMAITTGGCDPLPCLFRRMGVDASEFTTSGGNGRMHVYRGATGPDITGGGAEFAHLSLWNSAASLSKYDITFLSCECGQELATKNDASRAAMKAYLASGGRLFSTHYHYTWFTLNSKEFLTMAQWEEVVTQNPYTIDTSFPKGQVFAEWMQGVSNIVTGDQITLNSVRHSVSTVDKDDTTRWIYKPESGTTKESVKYFTFNTPIGVPAAQQCGRGVFTDIHISEDTVTSIPGDCASGPLTDQEKALVFLIFDLSSCIQPDEEVPAPPTPR